MGLAISTGMLADLLKNDEEGAEWLEKNLKDLNNLLIKNNLPIHQEPREIINSNYRGYCGSFPYSYLHYLRRALAYARQKPDKFKPAPAKWEPSSDSLIDRELTVYLDSHIICHSDAAGFYVPLDFEYPLYSEKALPITGDIVGSTVRARQELIKVAPLLDIKLDGEQLSDQEAEKLANEKDHTHAYWLERLVWFTFFEVVNESLINKSVIVFH